MITHSSLFHFCWFYWFSSPFSLKNSIQQNSQTKLSYGERDYHGYRQTYESTSCQFGSIRQNKFTQQQDKLKFLLTVLKIFYTLDLELQISIPELIKWRYRCHKNGKAKASRVTYSTHSSIYCMIYKSTFPRQKIFGMCQRTNTKPKKLNTRKFLILSYFDFKFLETNHLFPQGHELQVLINKLKAIKIELLESFIV